MNPSSKNSYVPLGLIYTSTFLALSILWFSFLTKGESNMDTGSIIAIVVATIGVASGIWAQVIQFKKDGQRIESVNATSSSVKIDTLDMKPRILYIEKNVQEVRDEVLITMANKYDQLDGISSLVEEMNYQKRRKQEISVDLLTPDYFINGIHKLYEKNTDLTEHIKELLDEIQTLKLSNLQLQTTLTNLQQQLDAIEKAKDAKQTKEKGHTR